MDVDWTLHGRAKNKEDSGEGQYRVYENMRFVLDTDRLLHMNQLRENRD